jgi:hypothetical protein
MSKSKILEPGTKKGSAAGIAATAGIEAAVGPSAVTVVMQSWRASPVVKRAIDGIIVTRPDWVIDVVERQGLLGPGLEKDTRIGGRVTHQLLEAAKARCGITSNTELLEYALAKVALEDDFGEFLVSRKGTVDSDLDLEF